MGTKVFLAALGLAGAAISAATISVPADWVVRTAAAVSERPAAAPWPTPADAEAASWLPVMGLMLPASHGAGLAVGARFKAVEAGAPGRLRELEIVDWVSVEAGAELPVIVVVARETDDETTSGPRPLLRLIVKLEGAGGADPAARARVGQL